jgi:uncharacterized protein YigE (DUF2233 family)
MKKRPIAPWEFAGRRLAIISALALALALGAEAATELGPGITYRNDRVPEIPWSVHLLKVERSRTNLHWVTGLANQRIVGCATLSEQIAGLNPNGGRPLAAINGGFFREHDFYEGDPRGLQILDGELVSAPDSDACFWIDAQNQPHISNVISQFHVTWPTGERVAIGLNEERDSDTAVLYTPRFGSRTGTAGGRELVLERMGKSRWLPFRPEDTYPALVREVRGANSRLSADTVVLSLGSGVDLPAVVPGSILKITLATTPDLTGVQTALGAGPVLVRHGKIASIRSNKSRDRHPRSAIGWNKDFFYLVAVDGRQRRLSMGMTLPELADYLVKRGCTEAMNLDGGGSAQLWVDGNTVNSPCYGHERPMANALMLLQKN